MPRGALRNTNPPEAGCNSGPSNGFLGAFEPQLDARVVMPISSHTVGITTVLFPVPRIVMFQSESGPGSGMTMTMTPVWWQMR